MNLAKLLVLVADDLGEPLDPAYRTLAKAKPAEPSGSGDDPIEQELEVTLSEERPA